MYAKDEEAMEPFQEWEVKDLRGFSMQHGHRSRIVHKKSRHKDNQELLPGRTSFKRKAGGNRCPARCGMCRPGRYHRAGGAKASKKTRNPVRGFHQRSAWLDIVQEARNVRRAIVYGFDMMMCHYEVVPPLHGKLFATASPVLVAPPKTLGQVGKFSPSVRLHRKPFSCKCRVRGAQQYVRLASSGGEHEEEDGFVVVPTALNQQTVGSIAVCMACEDDAMQ